MHSKRPDQAPLPEKQKPGPQLDRMGEPQSLPTDDRLMAPPPGLSSQGDKAERLKRIEREGEINRVGPELETNTGSDTVGVGQPTSQPVNQGQSLPQAALPVENKFEGRSDQFFDPAAAERSVSKKDRADRGSKKTDA